MNWHPLATIWHPFEGAVRSIFGTSKISPWLESALAPLPQRFVSSTQVTTPQVFEVLESMYLNRCLEQTETHDISRSSKKPPWELDNCKHTNSLQWNNNMSINDHSAIFSILRTTRLTYQPHQNFQGRGRKPTWSDRHLSLYCPRNCSAPQRVKHPEPKHCDNG